MNRHSGTWLSALMLLDFLLLTDPLTAQDAADVAAPDPPSSQTSDILSNYLAEEDPAYRWEKIREGKDQGVEYSELILRSQTWQEIEWKHRLFVIKPQNLKSSKQAVLFIGGGRWKDEYEDPNFQE
ncbi:MAG: PhoPQ-activated pathogenicity-related family protein, partial [Pirellulales bacterium]|nr:PhoPQ-activated pathogenicity-related family protein [Pirellulales bacterium]